MKHSTTQTIGVRMQKTLVKMLKACLKTSIPNSQSEFIRTAIQEKIQRDFPQIWQLFSSNLTEEQNDYCYETEGFKKTGGSYCKKDKGI